MSNDTASNDTESTNTSDAQSPDIDRVNAADWPARDFPIDDGRRENSVRVVIKQSVLNDIHRHGQTTTDVEICGVLVGAGYRDERGPFVFVEANIRGQHSDSKAAQVTFTGETWNHIHNELDRDFPDRQILGWYHTHPGFGIFLSGMDLFIHENYFSGEHQLAFVYDPIGGDEGLFVWRDGKALRDGFLIEPDEEEDPPPVAAAPPSEPMTAGAMEVDVPSGATDNGELTRRLTRIENRQSFAELGALTAVLLAMAVPLLMWFLWIRPQLPSGVPQNSGQRPVVPADIAPERDGAEAKTSGEEDTDKDANDALPPPTDESNPESQPAKERGPFDETPTDNPSAESEPTDTDGDAGNNQDENATAEEPEDRTPKENQPPN